MENKLLYTRFFLGYDNGVSGSIGIIGYSPENGYAVVYEPTPIIVQQDYTKKAKKISRIDVPKMVALLSKYVTPGADVQVMMERPMVNPQRFTATVSAIRAYESTLTIIEAFKFPYSVCDSKEWQKALLPSGVSGENLKSASLDVAKRLYPGKLIPKHPDADGLLIAHYCMIKYR